MGREVKRVALDFSWPMNKVWKGFLNPHDTSIPCPHCKQGYSKEMQELSDQWWGYIPFKPEDNGSVPFIPSDEVILAFADRNVSRAPDYYGTDTLARWREALRLCEHFNSSWSHHLNDADVADLLTSNHLLRELTHNYTPENGWQPKVPAYIPTAREVNEWNIAGIGLGSSGQWTVSEARCERNGWPVVCSHCNGEAHIWPSDTDRLTYENWQPSEPPIGEGWQMWETVSEGSPISPVFATPEGLAEWLSMHQSDTATESQWLAMIMGPGWAPSAIGIGGTLYTGVEAISMS